MPPTPRPESRSRRLGGIALASITAVSALGLGIANVALPSVAERFDISVTAVQWVTLAYLLTTTISVVLVGRVSDQFGRLRVLRLGILVFTAAALLAVWAPNPAVLVIARAVQGLGAAAMTALPMALVRELVARDRVGRAMGMLGSSMATGMALGPALGGILVSLFGWRGVFAALLVLGAAVLALARFALREPAPPRRGSSRFDFAGSALLVIALAAFAAAVTLRPGGWPGTAALLLVAALSAAGFVIAQLRAPLPLVDLRLMRTARLLPAFLAAFLAADIMMTFTVVPPFYLTRALGLDDAWMGLALAVGPVVAILSGVPAGRLVDRSDARRVAAGGLALMTLASILFATLPAALGSFGLLGFLIAAMLLTPGNQLFMAGNNTATMTGVGGEHQGVVSGILGFARNLGFTTGTGTAALLFESAARPGDPDGGATGGLQLSFAVAAAIGIAATGAALTTLTALTARRTRTASAREEREGH